MNEEAGIGHLIIPDWSDSNQKAESCSEASHNFAYKTIQGIAIGMTAGYDTIIGREMTVVDCKYGYIATPANTDKKLRKLISKSV